MPDLLGIIGQRKMQLDKLRQLSISVRDMTLAYCNEHCGRPMDECNTMCEIRLWCEYLDELEKEEQRFKECFNDKQ